MTATKNEPEVIKLYGLLQLASLLKKLKSTM